MHGFPLRDREGCIVNWCVLLTDIDDQKRAEALLAGENRIFEMVARGLPLAATLDARCTCVENLVFGWNCRTLLIESSSSRFRQGAAPSLPPSYNTILDGCSIGDEAAPPASAALFKRQVIVSDLASESRWDASGWRELALSHGLRSCVSTPIMSGDQKVLGTSTSIGGNPEISIRSNWSSSGSSYR